jgi:alpha-ketoglutarate-dependent taurine dioxygenase
MLSCPTFKKVEFIDLLVNAQYYGHLLNVHGVIGFKKINITEAQQYELSRRLGDFVNWVPNTSNSTSLIEPRYEKLESEIANKPKKQKLLVEWNMNQADKIRSVGSVISNTVFSCDRRAGSTLLMDMRKVFDLIQNEEWKEFISRIAWHDNETGISRSLVETHRNTNQKILMFFNELVVQSHSKTEINPRYRFFYKGEELDSEQKDMFVEIVKSMFEIIYVSNLDLIEEWKWNEKDLLIVDDSCMRQATKGGFRVGARVMIHQKCTAIQ